MANKKKANVSIEKKNKKEAKEELEQKEEIREELREEVKEEVKEEIKEEVKEEIAEDVKDELLDGGRIMPKRKVSFWAEFKAFLLIIVIIGLFSLGGWYWYTHMKDHSHKEKEQEVEKKEVIGYDYKIIDKEENEVKIVGDYIIFSKDEYVTKILSLSGSVLYEGNYKANSFNVGIDNNLYLLDIQDTDNESSITVSVFSDDEITKKFTVAVEDVYFSTINYQDEEMNTSLVGLVGSKYVFEDGSTRVEKAYFYDLKGNEVVLDGYSFSGDAATLDTSSPLVTNSNQYITFVNNEGKYGLFDYTNGKVVIEDEYDGLYATYNDSFIAIKDGKTGIINANEKILVIFEYDFIDKNEDFYVIGKDNKLALMNDDYEFITDFDFDYQKATEDHKYSYKLCCTLFNSFDAKKYGNKYLLTINMFTNEFDIKYDKNESYIISANGEYETVKQDGVGFLNNYVYFFDKKNNSYLFYDTDLEYKFTVDLSSYTFGKKYQSFYEFGDYVYVFGKDIYFDTNSGKEVKKPKEYFVNKNVTVVNTNKSSVISVDNEEIETLKNSSKNPMEYDTYKNGFYFADDEKLVLLIEK